MLSALALTVGSGARGDGDKRMPDLGQCQNLQVPPGNKVAFHAYAKGVQIYQWNGTKWVFVAPSARLFADAGYHGEVGMHFLDPALKLPAWQSNSGSKVVGLREAACTPDTTAIPWLLLEAVSTEGPGFLDNITFVQRVNTVGGVAPTGAGSMVGQIAEVPYQAEYYFYRE